MEAPRRPYEIILEIGADDLESIASALHSIEFNVFELIENGGVKDKYVSTSGSPSSGWNFSIIRTETADHDSYFKQLDTYLESKREERKS
jgi:hypothetical protein